MDMHLSFQSRVVISTGISSILFHLKTKFNINLNHEFAHSFW